MKKKKGLSLEDKRQILLKLFKGSGSFFHYKDIEKHCTQNKLSFMIVKDLLAGITADNLLETEKIGSSSFYWSLPNRIYDAKKKQLEREISNIENSKNEIQNLKQKIEENKAIRVENDERKKNLEELAELNRQKKEYEKILKDFENKDPEKYEQLISTTENMGQLNSFWIDNIFIVEQWMKNKRPDIDFEKIFPAVQELHLFD